MTIDRLSSASPLMPRATIARRAEPESDVAVAAPAAKLAEPSAGRDRVPGADTGYAIGSLMATAGERLDQFDRVLQSLRASLPADTYGGTSTVPTGVMVDRLA